jgi:hypothetical protein
VLYFEKGVSTLNFNTDCMIIHDRSFYTAARLEGLIIVVAITQPIELVCLVFTENQ